MTIERYKRRWWAVYDDNGELVCVTVYKKGAVEVVRRLTDNRTAKASGASHLLTDYPARSAGWSSVKNKKTGKDKKTANRYGLTVNEIAAADWLLTLYLARDHLDLGFGIDDAAIESIEAKGWIVLAWRFWASAFDLEQRRRQARTAASDPTKHERLCKRARLLLQCGTEPRELVSKLHESDLGAEYSKDWIRIILKKNKILKKRKTNKRR